MKTPVNFIQKRLPCIFSKLNIKNHHDHAETKFRVQDLALAQSGRFCFYILCQLTTRFLLLLLFGWCWFRVTGGRETRAKARRNAEEKSQISEGFEDPNERMSDL